MISLLLNLSTLAPSPCADTLTTESLPGREHGTVLQGFAVLNILLAKDMIAMLSDFLACLILLQAVLSVEGVPGPCALEIVVARLPEKFTDIDVSSDLSPSLVM